MEYATLYTVISSTDEVYRIGGSKAELAMEGIAAEWKKHETEWGRLYTEVHQLAVYLDGLGEEQQIPNMRPDGRKLRRNDLASQLFGKDIYGTVFIHPPIEKSVDLGTALNRRRPDSW